MKKRNGMINTKHQKPLSILLCMTILLQFVYLVSADPSADLTTPFKINDIAVTITSTGEITSHPDVTGTITQTAPMVFTFSNVVASGNSASPVLSIEPNVSIKLEGTNSFINSVGTGLMVDTTSFNGTGKLIATGGSGGDGIDAHGINGALNNVSGITIDASATNGHGINGAIAHVQNVILDAKTTSDNTNHHGINGSISFVNCGTINAVSKAGNGISVGVGSVYSGSVFAQGGIYGISGSLLPAESGEITAVGGTSAYWGAPLLVDVYTLLVGDSAAAATSSQTYTNEKYLNISYTDNVCPPSGDPDEKPTIIIPEINSFEEIYDAKIVELSTLPNPVDSNGNAVEGTWAYVGEGAKHVHWNDETKQDFIIPQNYEIKFTPSFPDKYVNSNNVVTDVDITIIPLKFEITPSSSDPDNMIEVGDKLPIFTVNESSYARIPFESETIDVLDWLADEPYEKVVKTDPNYTPKKADKELTDSLVAGHFPVTNDTNVELFAKDEMYDINPNNYVFVYKQTTLDIYSQTLSPSNIFELDDITTPYLGENLDDSIIEGIVKDDDGNTIPGSWSFVTPPKDVDDSSSDVVVTFTPDDLDKYNKFDTTIKVEITPVEITISAVDKTITSGDLLPSFDYTYSDDFKGNDTKESVVTKDPTVITNTDGNATGKFPIFFSEEAQSNTTNYIFSYQTATLTVNAAPTPPAPAPAPDPVPDTTPRITQAVADNITVEYDAENLENGLIVGTARDNAGNVVDGTWVFVTPPKDVDDSGNVNVTFIPNDNTYDRFTTTVSVTITPVVITVTADEKEIIVGDEIPELTFTYSNNFKGSDTKNTIVTEDAAFTTESDGTVIGEHPIVFSKEVVSNSSNYTFIYQDSIITVFPDDDDTESALEEEGNVGTPPDNSGDNNKPSIEVKPDGGIDIDTNRPDEMPNDVTINDESIEPNLFEVENGIVSISPEAFTDLDDGDNTIAVHYDDGVVESVVITDNGVPQSAYIPDGAWSLFDLIMTIVAMLLMIIYFVARAKKGKEDDAKTDDDYTEEESETRCKKRVVTKAILFVLAVFSVILLFITQDFTLPMTIFDIYSIVFAIIVIVQFILMIMMRKKEVKNEPQPT